MILSYRRFGMDYNCSILKMSAVIDFFVTLRLDSKCHLNCPQYTRWISDGRNKTIIVLNCMYGCKHVNKDLKLILSSEN